MSNSDWRKYAKIVGLASAAFLALAMIYGAGYFTGNLSGYYAGDADRAANQYPGDTQSVIDDCFELPSRPATVECVSEASAAAHENQRAEKDLVAQREMADWAWWVMVVGMLQFFATIATLGFVKLTLDATLEAVKGTGDATTEMIESNKIAREAQRAWVCYQNTHFEAAIGTDGKLSSISASLKFSNSGQTPTRSSLIRFAIVITPNEYAFTDIEMQVSNMDVDETSTAPIGPGQNVQSGAMPIDQDCLNIIANKLGRIFLWARIDYEDLFAPSTPKFTETLIEISTDQSFESLINPQNNLIGLTTCPRGHLNRIG